MNNVNVFLYYFLYSFYVNFKHFYTFDVLNIRKSYDYSE
nr:MAG TPA: hypothetical protein [Bacteriophage sp.]